MENASWTAEAEREALLAASPDAVIGIAPDGTIRRWSAAAEALFGYAEAEARGLPLARLLPDAAEEIVGVVAGRGERIAKPEAVALLRGGERRTVSLWAAPIDDAAAGALVLARDRAEQRRAEQGALVLETASRVALDILARRAGVEALEHIAEAARTLAGARYAALGVARPDGRGLQEFVTTGLGEAEKTAIGPLPHGRGVLGLLLGRTEPLRIDNLADHPASVGFPPGHPPMSSFLGVPIRRGDTVLGSLYLTNKRGGGAFTEADAVAVGALGAHAAVAIHNLQMLQRQRALVSGLIAAQEEERRAVAYDLHDGLTQYVMAAHAHLEASRRAREKNNAERAAREQDRGVKYLKEAVMESRRLVNGLRTLALDDLGLAGALEQLLVEEKTRAGWADADFLHNVAGRRFDKALETAVYRVAQEALTNARRHAGAGRVRLALLRDASEETAGQPLLTLEVRDWGCGFVPEQYADAGGHVGLQSMIERVRLMDGRWELTSAPGAGTIVRAVFPALDPQPDAAEEETRTS